LLTAGCSDRQNKNDILIVTRKGKKKNTVTRKGKKYYD